MEQTSESNKVWSLLALCSGFFMVIIDVTIVNVSLSNIADSLQASISGLQWVVAGYALTFSCFLLSAGSLGDRVGAKNSFLCGLVIFVSTSLGCGLANSLGLLVFFRLFQGVGAALLVPTSLALINASYENKEDRAKAIGIWASIGGAAGAVGPVLGAILTTWFNWRAVFFINVPIGIIALLLTIKYVFNPASSNKGGSFDLPGQITSIITVAALAFGLIEVGRWGWTSSAIITAFIVFIIGTVSFIIFEKRAVLPMFPLNFFSSKTFSATIAIGMLLNVGGYGELFVLSLYFQQIREYSILMTGFALIPLMGLGAIGSYLGGRVASVMGPKLPMIIGMLVSGLGFLGLLITEQSSPNYIALILPMGAVGFGMTFTMPAATIAIMRSVATDRAGIASGAFNASRQLGSLIGVAIFGTILTIAGNFIFGMHITLIISALAFLAASVAAFVWI